MEKKRELMRTDLEYKNFVKHILDRDNYTCKNCGVGKYNLLDCPKFEVCHIKGWAEYPELRIDKDNVITLCKNCHKKTDNYGYWFYRQTTTGIEYTKEEKEEFEYKKYNKLEVNYIDSLDELDDYILPNDWIMAAKRLY